MKQGNFFFISDVFFEKYDENECLMKNKEGVHNRPCFYAFQDKKQPKIFWCVPISSQVEKFENIVKNKIEKQIQKGQKNPKCNTIRFGEVMGQQRAFLIQNMFPVTEKYISSIYIDKNTKNPVTIASVTEKDICNNARDILKLIYRGNKNLVFADIMQIYDNLIIELNILE